MTSAPGNGFATNPSALSSVRSRLTTSSVPHSERFEYWMDMVCALYARLDCERHALGISHLMIGPQIDPGVPWCHAASPLAPDSLHVTLKSGNFGTADFFRKALRALAA
jgi:Nucleotide-binding C-terminal domain